MFDMTRGDVDLKQPCFSPLYADLKGLPPVYIQVGENEVLLDDSVLLHKRLLECGHDPKLATIAVRKGLFHDYHLHWQVMPEALEDLAIMCRYVAVRDE